MWAPSGDQRDQIKQAGLELAPGEQLASAVGQGTDIEGVTAILLLTGEDHYNALAATTLAGNSETPVYRLAPSHGAVAPYTPGETLFAPTLTRPALTARYTAGARITTQSSDGGIPPATDLLFLINPEGTLIPVTTSAPQTPSRATPSWCFVNTQFGAMSGGSCAITMAIRARRPDEATKGRGEPLSITCSSQCSTSTPPASCPAAKSLSRCANCSVNSAT